MKNKYLKKIGINILVSSLIVTPVATSLCTPMTVYAEEIAIDEDRLENTANVTSVNSGATVTTNKGGIDSNLGTVSYNEGIINCNNGTVETNNASGTISFNNNKVNINDGTIDYNKNNGGTVDTNNGTVKDNDGTVTTNESSGKIDTNDGDGKVSNNNGTVTTNIGTVESNNKTVTTNKGTVTSNASTGKVDTNEGTVKENYGTVTTNKNEVETNNGTVNANHGVVATNTGTITDNFGTVQNNTGTITDNYGDASVEGGTVSNQWVLISTNLDAVNFNMQSDTSTYVGETIRKKQIEGFGTETILDDKEAIYIRFGTSAYLFAGDFNSKIIVPDETDENTKEFIDAGKLTYDSTTNKSRLSLGGLETKVITLLFKILDKNTTLEEPPVIPSSPADSTASESNVTQVTQTPVAVADNTIIAKVPLATVQTTTTSTVQTATVPAATIANLNAAIPTNTEAPIVVNSVILQTNNGTDTGSAQTVTATVNVTTVNGKIGLSPQLVSGLKETVTSQLGSNSSKLVDIKVNTTSADGKPLSIVVNTNNLKNNVTLKAYIVDPKTGGYVLTEIPSVKYNDKTGITLPNLEGGYTYSFVSAKEAKAIENQIEKSVTLSDAFRNPVSSNPGSQVDMSKALSDSLNMANVRKIVYTVSGSQAVIDPVTGQLSVNDNATKGTITVTIKVTLMNGKTKTVKAKIKIG